MKIIGITRIRNEADILQETLDHWGEICDRIYVVDDGSDDGSLGIVNGHEKCFTPHRVHCNGGTDEGFQRGRVYEFANHLERPYIDDWFCCFDADERLEGITREDLLQSKANGIMCRVFDFYATPEDNGERHFVGPEYRDTLIFWRYHPDVHFQEGIVREPLGVKQPIERKGFIKHYGKARSEERWEAKCEHYQSFPEPYKSKWAARKGKFIHTESDFGRPLIKWEDIHKVPVGPCLYSYA